MSEWQEVKLGEVADIVGGGTPSTKQDEYYGSEISWITPKDLSGYNSRYISNGTRSITKLGLENSSAKLLPQNTVLFSSRAPIGYVAIANNELATNQGFKSLVCNPDKAYFKFIYYKMTTLKNELESIAGGSTFKEVSGKVVKEFIINLPPLEEQKAIADILSSLDDKIELNNQMNATLEEMAQALFKQWFVDFEFPNEDGQPYKSSGGEMVDSELGEIPKGWEVGVLGKLCHISAGGDKPKYVSVIKSDECNIPIYSNGITNEGLYGYSDTAKIKDKAVTISARGTIGFVCLRYEPYIPIVRLLSLIPINDRITSEYLYYLLKITNIQATGTTQQQVTVPQFKKQTIKFPNKFIINNFTEIVEGIQNKIKANQKENETLAELRNSLLPKLMSGEIRVK